MLYFNVICLNHWIWWNKIDNNSFGKSTGKSLGNILWNKFQRKSAGTIMIVLVTSVRTYSSTRTNVSLGVFCENQIRRKVIAMSIHVCKILRYSCSSFSAAKSQEPCIYKSSSMTRSIYRNISSFSQDIHGFWVFANLFP